MPEPVEFVVNTSVLVQTPAEAAEVVEQMGRIATGLAMSGYEAAVQVSPIAADQVFVEGHAETVIDAETDDDD